MRRLLFAVLALCVLPATANAHSVVRPGGAVIYLSVDATSLNDLVVRRDGYAAGMRVVRFSREEGLVRTGKYINDDGNGSNFWGVEPFTGSDGQRYIAGSDRDSGLQIFRYTGPAAPQRPACVPLPGVRQAQAPVRCEQG